MDSVHLDEAVETGEGRPAALPTSDPAAAPAAADSTVLPFQVPAVPAGTESVDGEPTEGEPTLADLDKFKPAGVRIIPDDPAVDWQNQKLAAYEFAAKLGVRRRTAGAPVRTMFLSGLDPQTPGPVASLLSGSAGNGGGRGGQLRLKLYLSLLWVAARRPYNVVRPARAWAALLGLPDFETKGVRRIQETLRELEQRGFIKVVDNPGHPSSVTPCLEFGSGYDFTPAPEAHAYVQRNGDPGQLMFHRYFRVPSTLWTEGHIARLKGPSLAMLLAILSEQRGTPEGVWFSPARAVERFGFSASTRTEGLRHLRDLGLIETTTKTVSESGAFIDWARRRNVHRIIGL